MIPAGGHDVVRRVLAVAMIASSGEAAVAELAFDRYEVVTGPAKRQTVLTGFLLDGSMADLAVLEVDENEDRRLRIFAFDDDTWVPRLDATLRPEVLFVDVASLGGRDRLITYEPGRLSRFDPESATERPLLAMTSSFKPPRRAEIPHVDITRDLNGDGRDDLVVPDGDGFWVFVQTSDGAFADPVKIGPSTDLAGIYGADGYRYDPWGQSRIHGIDYNRDGRDDLVFWNEDRFEVHLQDERGLYAPVARTFTTGVSFDSDEIFSLASGEMQGRVLHSLTDLSGDGVADLVVVELKGRSISGKRSSYEVHLGRPTAEGGTAFARDVDFAFASDDRIQLGMNRLDFDPDGRVALMFTTIEVEHLQGSLWKRLKGFMGDDVGLNLEFYRAEDGLYPDKPDAVHGIALDGVPSHREPGWVPLEIVLRGATHESRKTRKAWPRAFNRTLLIGDVTGDGRSDLVMEPEFRDLHIYVGVSGPELFARQPQRVAVQLLDGEYAWLVDLDRDGKQDILVHHPFILRDPHGAPTRPPGAESQRVTMLLVR